MPGVVASLAAITVADLFVQYPRLEPRYWFVTILMAMTALVAADVRSRVAKKLVREPRRLVLADRAGDTASGHG